MVCSRDALPKFREAPVTHFVSLVDPDETAAMEQRPSSAHHRMQLIFSDLDDIEVKLPQFRRYEPPKPEHVAQLVDFGRGLDGLTDWGLLAHCEAGISRSTAAAITILTAAGYKPQVAFGIVRRICPEMLPNRRILRFADDFLRTGGLLQRMAEIHRRKAFIRAGYEDPTNVRLREELKIAARPWTRLLRRLLLAVGGQKVRERILTPDFLVPEITAPPYRGGAGKRVVAP